MAFGLTIRKGNYNMSLLYSLSTSSIRIFLRFGVAPIFYNFLIELLPTLGLDKKKIEQQIKFELITISNTKKIPCYKIFFLWFEIEKQYNNSEIGIIIADHFTPDKAGLIGKLFMNTRNLKESVKLMDNYLMIIFGNIAIRYVETEDNATLHFEINPNFLIPLSVYECYAKICYNWANEYIKPHKILVKEVCFHKQKPKHFGYYTKLFPTTKILFGETSNYVVMNKSIFHIKNKNFSSITLNLALEHAKTEKQETLRKNLFSEDILYLIYINMPLRKNSIKDISKELELSISTIKRKLNQEQTNFTMLNEIARKKLSKPMIKDLTLSYDEVSFLLGYTEYSSFFRAFKKWHEETPSDYREKIISLQKYI